MRALPREGSENRVIIDTSPVKRQLGCSKATTFDPPSRCQKPPRIAAAAVICLSRPMMRHRGLFRPLQGSEALLYAAACEPFRLFLGSSAVEHSTVNRMVAGSNPARGANKISHLLQI